MFSFTTFLHFGHCSGLSSSAAIAAPMKTCSPEGQAPQRTLNISRSGSEEGSGGREQDGHLLKRNDFNYIIRWFGKTRWVPAFEVVVPPQMILPPPATLQELNVADEDLGKDKKSIIHIIPYVKVFFPPARNLALPPSCQQVTSRRCLLPRMRLRRWGGKSGPWRRGPNRARCR